MTEHWHRLPGEAAEFPLERFKTHLDMMLGKVLQVTLFEQGVGVDDLQGSLPTSATL